MQHHGRAMFGEQVGQFSVVGERFAPLADTGNRWVMDQHHPEPAALRRKGLGQPFPHVASKSTAGAEHGRELMSRPTDEALLGAGAMRWRTFQMRAISGVRFWHRTL